MTPPPDKRTLHLKLAATAAALILLLLAATGPLDRAGNGYTEQALKQALATFAVARGLNALISVAQGTEVALQPAGVGVNFAPGEVLDPINDLVEQFSWVMLAAATSLGIQQLLLEIFAAPAATALLALPLTALLFLLWRPLGPPALRHALLRVTLILLILRFAVPLAALANELFYDAFLEPRYAASTLAVEAAEREIRELQQSEPPHGAAGEDEGLLERVKKAYLNTLDEIDLERRLKRYREAAANLSEQIVQLIVTFVVQTLLLPLLFLWLIVHAIRIVWRINNTAP